MFWQFQQKAAGWWEAQDNHYMNTSPSYAPNGIQVGCIVRHTLQCQGMIVPNEVPGVNPVWIKVVTRHSRPFGQMTNWAFFISQFRKEQQRFGNKKKCNKWRSKKWLMGAWCAIRECLPLSWTGARNAHRNSRMSSMLPKEWLMVEKGG